MKESKSMIEATTSTQPAHTTPEATVLYIPHVVSATNVVLKPYTQMFTFVTIMGIPSLHRTLVAHGSKVASTPEDIKKTLSGSIDEKATVSITLTDGTVTTGIVKVAAMNDYISKVMMSIADGLGSDVTMGVPTVGTTVTQKAEKSIIQAVMLRVVSIDDFLQAHAFKKHAFLLGKHGVGKTYNVKKYADALGHAVIDIGLNKGTTPTNLLGHAKPSNVMTENGDNVVLLTWLDGLLSQACRAAQTEKVVLILDEILRADPDVLSVLISCMSPDHLGQFVLNTGRILATNADGIAVTEILRVPKENLWITATANVGTGYDVSIVDAAFLDRFHLYYVDLTIADIKAILTNIVANKFPKDTTLVHKLVKVSTVLQDLHDKGNLHYHFTLRHLSEAIDSADTPEDVKRYLGYTINNIVTQQTSGSPSAAEIDLVTQALDAHL